MQPLTCLSLSLFVFLSRASSFLSQYPRYIYIYTYIASPTRLKSASLCREILAEAESGSYRNVSRVILEGRVSGDTGPAQGVIAGFNDRKKLGL